MKKSGKPSLLRINRNVPKRYSDVLQEPRWDTISSSESALYPWVEDSTYVRLPSFFEGILPEPAPIEPIHGAKVLLKLGDSVTTTTLVQPALSHTMDRLANT